MKEIEAIKCKSGKLALWERGGAGKTKRFAYLITDPDGRKKKSIFVPWKESKNWKQVKGQALIPIEVGDCILYNQMTRSIMGSNVTSETLIIVSKIVKIDEESGKIWTELINIQRNKVWAGKADMRKFNDAIRTAIKKSTISNNNYAHYCEFSEK